ncbi:MAG: serine hydrolase, partial [Erysipelotrichaceae bacterium]|nr:serine hydrolase [Erysipelotrichaceae bacterium]
MKSLKKQIEHILTNTKSQVSLLIKDLETDTILYDLDSQRQLVSASTIKVPIMYCAFNEVMLGNLSLHQQINVVQSDILSDSEVFEHGETTMSLIDLVSWMIISSDN